MEHIMQIGINIDDEAIQKAAVNQAAKQITDDMKKILFQYGYGYYNRDNIVGFTSEFEKLLNEKIESYKEEIIERVVDKLTDSFKRSKKYKEALQEGIDAVR